ncbi:DUF3606 domain-containing protein [Rhizobium sp. 22-785-1]
MIKTLRDRAQDPKRITAGQDYVLSYEAKKEDVTKAAVKKSVKKVGNSRTIIEADLEKIG